MDYFEVEGKKLLQKYGIPTDDGFLVNEEAVLAGDQCPCVA